MGLTAVNSNSHSIGYDVFPPKKEEEVAVFSRRKETSMALPKTSKDGSITSISGVLEETKSQEKTSYLNLAIRVGKAALPIFKVYPPLSKPITAILHAEKSVSSFTDLLNAKTDDRIAIAKGVVDTALSIAIFVSTILYHPLGMGIDAARDGVVNSIKMIQCLSKHEYKKAFDCCFNIVFDALYLSTFFYFAIELEAIVLGVEFLLLNYEGINEFIRGNYIEGVGNVLLGAVRVYEISPFVPEIHRKYYQAS